MTSFFLISVTVSSASRDNLLLSLTLPTAERSYLSDLASVRFLLFIQKVAGKPSLATADRVINDHSASWSIIQLPADSINSLDKILSTFDLGEASDLHSTSSLIKLALVKNKSKNNLSDVSSVGGSPGLIILYISAKASTLEEVLSASSKVFLI